MSSVSAGCVFFFFGELHSQKSGKKRDSPTISELCEQNKKPFQTDAKIVCSSGLFNPAAQQLKHLPVSSPVLKGSEQQTSPQ